MEGGPGKVEEEAVVDVTLERPSHSRLLAVEVD